MRIPRAGALTLALTVALAMSCLLAYYGEQAVSLPRGDAAARVVSVGSGPQEGAEMRSEWTRTEVSPEWNLRVVITSRRLDIPSAELLVYSYQEPIESARVGDADLALAAQHHFGELIFSGRVALEDDATDFLLTVPEDRPLVCVVQSVLEGQAQSTVLTPIPSKPFSIADGQRTCCEFHLDRHSRIRFTLLGQASACESLDVSLAAALPEPLLQRFTLKAKDQFTLVGVAGVPISVWGRGGICAFPMRLSPGYSDQLRFPVGQSEQGLYLPSPSGRLILCQEGTPQRVEHRLGLRVNDLSEFRYDHGLVALQSLTDSGYSRFYIQVRGHGISRVALAELRHESNGDVRVEVALGPTGTVWIAADRPIAYEEWDIFARPTSREHEGFNVPATDGLWKLDSLDAGAWDFYWVQRREGGREWITARLGYRVEAGAETHITCEFREPRPARIALRNWKDVPQELRPLAAYVDGFPCKGGADGLFTAELTPPFHRYSRIVLQCPFIGGTVVAENMAEVADGIEADIPANDFNFLLVPKRFGGDISVDFFYEPSTLAGPRFALRRELRPWADNGFRFIRGVDIPCAVSERLPGADEVVFRGFLLVDGSESKTTADCSGRWVEVVSDESGVLVAEATMIGMDLRALIKTLPEGHSRIWLPDSARRIVFISTRGTRTIDTDTIGTVLTLQA